MDSGQPEPEAAQTEATTAQRAPAPAKKSLEQFLAEFEERLRVAPEEPATDALLALDDRATGFRHSPVESQPERPPRLPRPRPWQTSAGDAAVTPAEVAPSAGNPVEVPAEAPPETTPATVAPPERSPGQKHHHRRRRRHR